MIERDVVDVRKRLGRLYDVIEKGELIMTDLAPRIRELRDRENALVRDLQVIRDSASENGAKIIQAEDVLTYLKDLKGLLSAGTMAQRKTLLRCFVKLVSKKGQTIDIEYSLPLPPEKTGLGAEGVPPTVSFDGPNGTVSRTFEITVRLTE